MNWWEQIYAERERRGREWFHERAEIERLGEKEYRRRKHAPFVAARAVYRHRQRVGAVAHPVWPVKMSLPRAGYITHLDVVGELAIQPTSEWLR